MYVQRFFFLLVWWSPFTGRSFFKHNEVIQHSIDKSTGIRNVQNYKQLSAALSLPLIYFRTVCAVVLENEWCVMVKEVSNNLSKTDGS